MKEPPVTRPATAESITELQRYQPELVGIEKDDIYGAIRALEIAVSYMPFVTFTEVPRWAAIRNADVISMQNALDRLKQARDER